MIKYIWVSTNEEETLETEDIQLIKSILKQKGGKAYKVRMRKSGVITETWLVDKKNTNTKSRKIKKTID